MEQPRFAPQVARQITIADPLLTSLASAALRAGPVGWACTPEVALMVETPHEQPLGRPRPLTGAARNVRRATVGRAGARLRRVGPVLFVDTSVQIHRVLVPVLAELEKTYGEAVSFRLPRLGPRAFRAARSEAATATAAFRAWFGAHGLHAPGTLADEVLKVAVLSHRARAVSFRARGVEAIAVGTQHNGSTRALLAAAAEHGVLSVYVPHAPVARNAYYADLPVDVALLRGPSEVDHYRALGVTRVGDLVVVGDPGGPTRGQTVPIPAADHVLYAPSTHSEAVLRADVAVIEHAVERPVVLSLHARMRVSAAAALFPSAWMVLPPVPTITNVREHGAHALIQHGSGVGLEAMTSGVEVIDLCATGELPNYPYLHEPHVQVVHDGPSLRIAVDAVPGRSNQRCDRVAYAQTWSAAGGADSAEAAARAIVDRLDHPVERKFLLDGWRRRAEG